MKIFSTIKLNDRMFYLTDEQSSHFLKESVFAKSSKQTGISKFIKYYDPYKDINGDAVARFIPTTNLEYHPTGYERDDENGYYVEYLTDKKTIGYFNPWYPKKAKRVVEDTYAVLDSTIRISTVPIEGIAIGDYVIFDGDGYVKASPVDKYTRRLSYVFDNNGEYIQDSDTKEYINPFTKDPNWWKLKTPRTFTPSIYDETTKTWDPPADWIYGQLANDYDGYYLPYFDKFDVTKYLTRYKGTLQSDGSITYSVDKNGEYVRAESSGKYYNPNYSFINQEQILQKYYKTDAVYERTDVVTDETYLQKGIGYVRSDLTEEGHLIVVNDGHGGPGCVEISLVQPTIPTVELDDVVKSYPIYWQPYKESSRYKMSSEESSTFVLSDEGTYIEIEPFNKDNVPMHGFYSEYPEYIITKDKFVLGGESIFELDEEDVGKYVTIIEVANTEIENGSIDRISGQALPDYKKSRTSVYYKIGYTEQPTERQELRYSLNNDQGYWCQVFEYKLLSSGDYEFIRSYRLDYGATFSISDQTTHIRVCSGDSDTTGMTGLVMRLVTDPEATYYAERSIKVCSYDEAYLKGYYYFFDCDDRSMFCKLIGNSKECQGYERYQFSGAVLSQVNELASSVSSVSSSINQTDSSIITKVQNLDAKLMSEIEQLSSRIGMTVTADNSLLEAKVAITADSLTSAISSGVTVMEGGTFNETDVDFSKNKKYKFGRIVPIVNESYHFELYDPPYDTSGGKGESSIIENTVEVAWSNDKPYVYFDPKIVYKEDPKGSFLCDSSSGGYGYFNPYSSYRKSDSGNITVIADKDKESATEIHIARVFDDLPYINVNDKIEQLNIKRYILVNKGSYSRSTQGTTGALKVIADDSTEVKSGEIRKQDVEQFIPDINVGDYVVPSDRHDSNNNGKYIFSYHEKLEDEPQSGVNESLRVVENGETPTAITIREKDVVKKDSTVTISVGDIVRPQYYDPYSGTVVRYSIYQTYCRVTDCTNKVYSYSRYADLGRQVTSLIRQYSDSILLQVGEEASERAAINITTSGISMGYEELKKELENKIEINGKSISSTMTGAFTVVGFEKSYSDNRVTGYTIAPEWNCETGVLKDVGDSFTYKAENLKSKSLYVIMENKCKTDGSLFSSELMIRCNSNECSGDTSQTSIPFGYIKSVDGQDSYFFIPGSKRYKLNESYDKYSTAKEGDDSHKRFLQDNQGPYRYTGDKEDDDYDYDFTKYEKAQWYIPTVGFRKYYSTDGESIKYNLYVRGVAQAVSNVVQTLDSYAVMLSNGALNASFIMQLLNNESVVGISADKINLNGSVIASNSPLKAVRIDAGNIFSSVKNASDDAWPDIGNAKWYLKSNGEFMTVDGILGASAIPIANNTTAVKTYEGNIYSSKYTVVSGNGSWSDINSANWYLKSNGDFMAREGILGLTSLPIKNGTTAVRTHEGNIYNSTYNNGSWSDINSANWYIKADGTFMSKKGNLAGLDITNSSLRKEFVDGNIKKWVEINAPESANDTPVVRSALTDTTNYYSTNTDKLRSWGYTGSLYDVEVKGGGEVKDCILLQRASDGSSTGTELMITDIFDYSTPYTIQGSIIRKPDSATNKIIIDVVDINGVTQQGSFTSGTEDLKDVNFTFSTIPNVKSVRIRSDIVPYSSTSAMYLGNVVINASYDDHSGIQKFAINFDGSATFSDIEGDVMTGSKFISTKSMVNNGAVSAWPRELNDDNTSYLRYIKSENIIFSNNPEGSDDVPYIKFAHSVPTTKTYKIKIDSITYKSYLSAKKQYVYEITVGNYLEDTKTAFPVNVSFKLVIGAYTGGYIYASEKAASGQKTYTFLASSPIGPNEERNGNMYIGTNFSKAKVIFPGNYGEYYHNYQTNRGLDIGGNNTDNRMIGTWTSANGVAITSARAAKDNIDYVDSRYTDMLYKLKPRTYTLKSESSGYRHAGLILDEMKDAMDSCGITPKEMSAYNATADGLGGITYTELIPILVKEIQNLRAEINDLKSKYNQ